MIYASGPGENGGSSRSRSRVLLQRIAEALGVKVDDLGFTVHSTGQLDQLDQLITLWSRIDDPVKRRFILDFVQKLVEQEG